jgi:hypothetical protein
VQRIFPLLLLLAWAIPAWGQPAAGGGDLAPADALALVDHALANELRAAQDSGHPMRYRLHKTSPNLTSTKEIYETRDGEVAQLTEIGDNPLSGGDEQKEQDRLNALLADPGKQRHRKMAEDADADRALKVLRALPGAFVYQYAGTGDASGGKVEKFTFRPNSSFSPPDLETEILTQMAGEIWIDAAHERVVKLEGHLQQDVDFGWGILGRLNKGGWIAIEQAEIGGGVWRIVHFQMVLSGRVFFKTRAFDTTEEESHYEPLPVGLSYQKAIEMLRAE